MLVERELAKSGDKMAIGEEAACPHHDGMKVALYCKSCEQLICTKCISQGPVSSARHREHVYLDLQEAYEMEIEDLDKMKAKFRMALDIRKEQQQNVQNKIQKMKFELLRKKTQVSKRTRPLKSKLKSGEREFKQKLQDLIQPAVDRVEEIYVEIENDVARREKLLRQVEISQELDLHQCLLFLKNIHDLKSAMDDTVLSDEGRGDPASEPCPELAKLTSVSLSLLHQNKLLGKAFHFPCKVPSQPGLLRDWCVIGSDRLSLVYKFKKSEHVLKFLVYYRRTSLLESLRKKPLNLEEYDTIRIRQQPAGRIQFTLRNLQPNTCYEVRMCAVNNVGYSEHTISTLRTSEGLTKQVLYPERQSFTSKLKDLVVGLVYVSGLLLYVFLLVYMCSANVEHSLCEQAQRHIGSLNDACPVNHVIVGQGEQMLKWHEIPVGEWLSYLTEKLPWR